MKTKIFLVCLLLVSVPTYPQQPPSSLLIYAEGNEYLLTHIEETIRSLLDAGTKKPLFDRNRIALFNRFVSNRTDQDLRRTIIDYYNRAQKFEETDGQRDTRLQSAEILSNPDLFLKININKIDQIMEYQFILYPVSDTLREGESTYSLPDLARPLSSESISFRLTDDNHKIRVEQAIRRIFPGSNSPPSPVIQLNGASGRMEYQFALNDTLLLDASYSTDDDTPIEDWKFRWRQLDPVFDRDAGPNNRLEILPKAPKQHIVLSRKGTYRLELQLDDGIVRKKPTKQVHIRVMDRPTLRLAPRKFNFYERGSLLGGSSPLPKIDEEMWLFTETNLDSLPLEVKLVRKKQKFDTRLDSVIYSTLEEQKNAAFRGQVKLRFWKSSVDSITYKIGIQGTVEPGLYDIQLFVRDGDVTSFPVNLNLDFYRAPIGHFGWEYYNYTFNYEDTLAFDQELQRRGLTSDSVGTSGFSPYNFEAFLTKNLGLNLSLRGYKSGTFSLIYSPGSGSPKVDWISLRVMLSTGRLPFGQGKGFFAYGLGIGCGIDILRLKNSWKNEIPFSLQFRVKMIQMWPFDSKAVFDNVLNGSLGLYFGILL